MRRTQPKPPTPCPLELDFTNAAGEIVIIRGAVTRRHFTRRLVVRVVDAAGLPPETAATALRCALLDGRCKGDRETQIAVADGWPISEVA